MRLIDADTLIEQMEADAEHLDNAISKMMYYAAIIDVKHAPTIEPERKKGKWIDKSGGIECAWNYCSVCGEQAIDLYDFCPNCGADMRGDRDD